MSSFSFQSKPIYILDALRTAMGSPFKSLKDFSAGQLGGFVVDGLLKRARITSDEVDELIFGNTVLAGGGQNPARQAALFGGLSVTTPAYTVNQVCGAGLQAVILAGQAMTLGAANCVIAGGTESATKTPQMFSKLVDTPFNEREPVDSLIYDGLWCSLSGQHMGQLAEQLAGREKISRNAQDEYALMSHLKAAAGQFTDEIISVGDFKTDERIRRRVTIENFQTLPPAFSENGTVTSGNSSVPCDGAAGLVLATGDFKKMSFARLVGYASVVGDPKDTFTFSVCAIEQCLKVCGIKLKDIDLFEVSEAFAAQVIFTRDSLRIPSGKMNIYGGDLALGHALGAAGARILVTLAHALKRENKKYGLASICYGGGGALCVILENSQ